MLSCHVSNLCAQAGIIEEMVEDTLEDALGDDDELEEDVQNEVDKVLFELTAGELYLFSVQISFNTIFLVLSTGASF